MSRSLIGVQVYVERRFFAINFGSKKQWEEPESIKAEKLDGIVGVETDTKKESGSERAAALRRASTSAPSESTQSSTGAEVAGLLNLFLRPQHSLRTSAALQHGLWP
jgi:hypothetical protein